MGNNATIAVRAENCGTRCGACGSGCIDRSQNAVNIAIDEEASKAEFEKIRNQLRGGLKEPCFDEDSMTFRGAFRAAPFEVALQRQGKHWRNLGLVVCPQDVPYYHLTVDQVLEPSLISDWNKTQSPMNQVVRGDAIVSVNGLVGSSREMVEKIQAMHEGSVIRFWVEPRLESSSNPLIPQHEAVGCPRPLDADAPHLVEGKPRPRCLPFARRVDLADGFASGARVRAQRGDERVALPRAV